MTSKELEEKIKSIEKKMEKMENLEERLEKAFQNVERYRDKMIQNGYSYQMLEEFNHAIQPITQHCNEIRNARKKIAMLQEEQMRMEQAERQKKSDRASMLISHLVLQQAQMFPYNTKCRNFSFTDGEAICEIKMDLQYCGNNCPYATNQVCSNKVDGKGRTVAYKKRRRLI